MCFLSVLFFHMNTQGGNWKNCSLLFQTWNVHAQEEIWWVPEQQCCVKTMGGVSNTVQSVSFLHAVVWVGMRCDDSLKPEKLDAGGIRTVAAFSFFIATVSCSWLGTAPMLMTRLSCFRRLCDCITTHSRRKQTHTKRTKHNLRMKWFLACILQRPGQEWNLTCEQELHVIWPAASMSIARTNRCWQQVSLQEHAPFFRLCRCNIVKSWSRIVTLRHRRVGWRSKKFRWESSRNFSGSISVPLAGKWLLTPRTSHIDTTNINQQKSFPGWSQSRKEAIVHQQAFNLSCWSSCVGILLFSLSRLNFYLFGRQGWITGVNYSLRQRIQKPCMCEWDRQTEGKRSSQSLRLYEYLRHFRCLPL